MPPYSTITESSLSDSIIDVLNLFLDCASERAILLQDLREILKRGIIIDSRCRMRENSASETYGAAVPPGAYDLQQDAVFRKEIGTRCDAV